MTSSNETRRAGGAAGLGNSSCLDGIDGSELSPPNSPFQAKNSATAPLILDLQYWNVELDLRLSAAKAIQAATDLEIGEPDDIAERNIRVAVNHLKDAAARFRQILNAKAAAAAKILAGALR